MNHEKTLNQPVLGKIRIQMPHGTVTVHDARFNSIHTTDGKWQPFQVQEVVGRKVTYRPNLRTWFKQALRNAEIKESISQPTQGVTRTRYYRRGVFGAQTTVQFDSRGTDIIWELRVDIPAVSFTLRQSRCYLRRGHFEIETPEVTVSPFGSLRWANFGLLSIWNYPWGSSRAWGISVARIRGSSLFVYANPEEGESNPRLDVLWRHIEPRNR